MPSALFVTSDTQRFVAPSRRRPEDRTGSALDAGSVRGVQRHGAAIEPAAAFANVDAVAPAEKRRRSPAIV
jgi:hypothetical protein